MNAEVGRARLADSKQQQEMIKLLRQRVRLLQSFTKSGQASSLLTEPLIALSEPLLSLRGFASVSPPSRARRSVNRGYTSIAQSHDALGHPRELARLNQQKCRPGRSWYGVAAALATLILTVSPASLLYNHHHLGRAD